MKKTVLASTLAVGLGVTGIAAGNSADASEQGIDQAQLAQQAQNNPQQLNAEPIHEGAYNYNFNQDNLNYNFESDGTYWSWSYGEGSNGSNDASAQSTSDAGQQEQAPQTQEQTQPQQEAASSQQSTDSSSEASSGSSVEVNDHLKQIAQRESGGDLNAVNPSSGAAGKYQFLQSTWDSVAPDEYKGQSPTEAPESVQDQAAMDLYESEGASQWVTA
ncbi:transglycosylase family protein [Staphylococcus cohnii]|uniref:transglycosylase family protein n=1 Tax=Staphylococcus cohnii TaxID=29382 RepID=UPI000CD27BD8|nr:transglycosylase family protein [Staphylococcus cohnii]AYX90991.1 transglycosylase [Staphylococcus cohnii]PNZ42454.1 transglycosylase [Staphylococcus cohnii subsp. cohnii]GEP88343.1 putative transglycosylase SceD [Staphylococcus cohnii subsp. cohnii]SUM05717.1 SceD-like transglycosylase, biomarker for vancomycin-intermediate strains [Staphylococcus cohnii]